MHLPITFLNSPLASGDNMVCTTIPPPAELPKMVPE